MASLRFASRHAALIVATLAPFACSAFNPSVGPLRGDAGAPAPACSLGAGGYASSYGSQSPTVVFCSLDGGMVEGACDTCEATFCCSQRVACYSDQTCSCADETFDNCLSTAEPPDGGGSDAGAASTGACWNALRGSGGIGQARVQCLKTNCKSVCGVPD
jgi:hypothetical protein